MFHMHLRRMCILLLLDGMFCIYQLSSFDVSGVLKSPNIIVLLSISPFKFNNIYFMYLGAVMLGAYTFIIVISSSWIDPFIIMYCPSLSFITVFVLKSILSDMSIGTPVLIFFPFSYAWNIFFYPLTFSLCVSLFLK